MSCVSLCGTGSDSGEMDLLETERLHRKTAEPQAIEMTAELNELRREMEIMHLIFG